MNKNYSSAHRDGMDQILLAERANPIGAAMLEYL